MATVDPGLIEQEDYEYVLRGSRAGSLEAEANTVFISYEGLPSNFSLAANMTAGAFAGIAV